MTMTPLVDDDSPLERDHSAPSSHRVAKGARRIVIEGQSYSREEVIHRYLPLVKYFAGRILAGMPRNFELGDLINDGVIGLIDASEKFDDTRGVKFNTYAAQRIRGAIIDAMRAFDPVSRPVRRRAKEIAHAEDQLEAELERPATSGETAERLGLSVEKLQEAKFKSLAGTLLSLDDPLKVELRDTLRETQDDVSTSVEWRELQGALAAAISELPQVERFVIDSYYFKERASSSLAEELGVSLPRVYQIHARAVRRLHTALAALRTDFGYGVAEPAGPRKYMRKAEVLPIPRAGAGPPFANRVRRLAS
jgi:RNA polymerase sigma factor for flagellar operon FliA